MSKPWQTLDSVPTPEGALELRRRGDREFLIVVGGRVLMTSVARRSEEALGTLGCAHLVTSAKPRVLVGGLGMGFTLRAVLDAVPAKAAVTVAELNPIVVGWCKGPLAALTDHAIADPRVRACVGDAARTIADASPGSWDAILLDLYEGPHAATQTSNDPFYSAKAIESTVRALAPKGVFAIWSEEADAPFERRLSSAGLTVVVKRAGAGGRSHVVYLAMRR